MGAELRVLRRRIRSVESTKKITRAQELIAASRIIRAQQRAEAARPYTRALVSALEAAAANARLDNPLLEGVGEPRRSAVLVVTSDRGFAGAYSANVIRQTEALSGLLVEQGQEVVPYVVGQKGVTWFRFRGRDMAGEYTGYSDARMIADDLLAAINTPTDEGGVDEIHIVSTHFVNMVTQEVRARRLFPIVVEDVPEPLHRVEAGPVRTPEGATRPDPDAPRLVTFRTVPRTRSSTCSARMAGAPGFPGVARTLRGRNPQPAPGQESRR